MLYQEGETVVLSTFDLPQVLGAQRAGNNNTFVRSRTATGLRKPAREAQGPLCCGSGKSNQLSGKIHQQNTGTKRTLGLSRGGLNVT